MIREYEKPTPSELEEKPKGEVDKYIESSKEQTPMEFGRGTLNRLEQLFQFHPTEADIKANNIEGMKEEGKKLQIDLQNLLETVPKLGHTNLEQKTIDLIREKLTSALIDSMGSAKEEQDTESEEDALYKVYNNLNSANKKIRESSVLLELLENWKDAEYDKSKLEDENFKLNYPDKEIKIPR